MFSAAATLHRYSPQTRVLRGILLRKALVYFVVYTAIVIIVASWANAFMVPDIAEWVASSTSTWTFYSPEDYDALLQNTPTETLSNLQVYSGTNDSGDIEYAVRDLTTYFFIKSFKIPVFLCLYFIGILLILLSILNKSFRYFDILTSSVAQLITNKNANVVLPDDLSIVRSELNEIKSQSLIAEHNAHREEERKNELVAYLAHDIKTPLTSIMGYTSLLKEAPDLPINQRIQYAEISYEKAEHLEGLIDELFEITRYNLQSIPIERENLNVALFCQQISDEFYPEASKKDLSIVVEASDELMVFADPEKLARAVSNVIRNALAYAEKGSKVYLRAQKCTYSLDQNQRNCGEETNSFNCVAYTTNAFTNTSVDGVAPNTVKTIRKNEGIVISVQNNGKEISQTHLQSIFEKFFREDQARSTNKGGAGLGLAIAKEIMVAHGGSISATSEHGVTTFLLCLPLKQL